MKRRGRNGTLTQNNSNGFIVEIPTNLTKMKQLRYVMLDKNNISGHVPKGFVDMIGLILFYVSYNNLFGPLLSFSGSIWCDSFIGNHFNESFFPS